MIHKVRSFHFQVKVILVGLTQCPLKYGLRFSSEIISYDITCSWLKSDVLLSISKKYKMVYCMEQELMRLYNCMKMRPVLTCCRESHSVNMFNTRLPRLSFSLYFFNETTLRQLLHTDPDIWPDQIVSI